jgi:hypothetical protein
MADHAQQPTKKLTKAEAGRLGGLRTKQRHGSAHYHRAGKLGAQAVIERHGTEHLQAIGRKGFSALAGRLGCYRSRRAAVQLLQAQGRLSMYPIERVVAALAKIPADPDTENGPAEDTAIAAILVSIRSDPNPQGGPQP